MVRPLSRDRIKSHNLYKIAVSRKGVYTLLGIAVVAVFILFNVLTASAGVVTIDLISQADAKLDGGTTWANWNQATTGGTWTLTQNYSVAGWYVTTDPFDTGTGSWYSSRSGSSTFTASIYHTFTVPTQYNSSADTLVATFYWKKLIGTAAVAASNVRWQIIRASDSFVMGSGTVNSATAANTNINWTQQTVDLKSGLTTPVSAGVTYRLWLGHDAGTGGSASSSSVAFDVGRVTLTSTQVPTVASVTYSKSTIVDNNTDSTTITATVYDQFSNPINGQTVNFTTNPVVGSFSPAASATTNASGQASVTYKANNDGGSNVTITATAGSSSNQTTVTVLTPTTLTLSPSPTSIPNDNTTTSTITAHLVDNLGNPMSGEQINFSTNLGTLSAASATTDASGNATVTLKSATGGSATITGTDNRKPAVSGTAGVTVLAPQGLTMSASLYTIPNDNTTTTTITAHVYDQNNNPVSGLTVNFSKNAGTGTLSAASAVTNASGDATVTFKSNTGSTVTITGTASRAPNPANTVVVTVQAPTTLTLSAAPTSIPNDNATTSTITAHLVDQNGSAISGEQINFTTTLGTLSAASATTNSSGNATVTIKSGTTGSAAITGTVNRTPAITGNTTVTVFAPVPTTVTLSRSPASVVSNNTSTSTITAHLVDQNSNPMSGQVINFSTTLGTLSASSANTNSSGDATVTIKSGSVGVATITGTVYSAPSVNNSTTVTFSAPDPTTLTVSAAPSSIPADNLTTSTITAHLVDQSGNAMSGQQINFSTNAGTLSAAAATTNASGDATVTIKSNVITTGTITAAVNSKPSLSGNVTVNFTVVDTTPPTFTKAEATSKQIIYLSFSEPIQDPNTSGATVQIDNGALAISSVYLMPDAQTVRLAVYDLVYGNQYPNPQSRVVKVQNIKDLAGNIISPNPSTQSYDVYSPHGKYAAYQVTSGNSTRICGQCHLTHSATYNYLLNGFTIKKVCFVCHGTVGTSNYKVENEFYNWSDANVGTTVYSISLHKALDSDSPGQNILVCTDCHDPHGTRISGTNNIYPKLLYSKNVYGAVYTTANGNWFCLACHGFGDNGRFGATFWNSYGGDHNNGMTVTGGVYNAVHYDSRISVLQPASQTNVTCSKCHERHGSTNPLLIDRTVNYSVYAENLCYKCHGDTTANNLDSGNNPKRDIYRQFNIPSAPPVAPTLSYSNTGGSLAGNATYYFIVAAYSSTTGWESLPSPEASIDIPSGTNTNQVTVTIPQYSGASNYFDTFRVYMGYRLNAPAPTLGTVAATAPRDFVWNLSVGTYYVKVTALGRFGETRPSPEVSQYINTNQNLTITVPNFPNVAGYANADAFKIYISTTSGAETYQATAPNNSMKTQIDPLKTGGETPPTFANNNNIETYQGSVTANLGGATTYNQTAAPVTKWPVAKGSSHQVMITNSNRTGSKIECTNCHGPHTVANVTYAANQPVSDFSDPTNTKKYWVSSGTSDSTKTVGTWSDWCLKCHSGTGSISSVTNSTTVVPFTLGWPNLNFTNNNSGWFKDTVWPNSVHKINGYVCTNCHDPHGTREHLILKVPYDGFDYDGNCLRCHNGSTPPAKNIKAEFQKAARHPTLDAGFGDHEIDENYQGMGDTPRLNRHAKCEDCHDPHSADGTTTTAPNPSGAIKNVTGVGFSGARPAWTSLSETDPLYVFKRPLQYEYELCYKCHSSYSFGTTIHFSTSGAMETDIAMQFNPANPSYHPVEAAGKNSMTGLSGNWVGSWGPTSRVYCFDCHGDNLKNADGTTNTNLIRGPHGSINRYMLKAPYQGKEFSPTGKPQNDLCTICHNPATYDTSGSGTGSDTAFRQGTTNLHLNHKNNLYLDFGGANQWFCGDCHGLYIHGQKRPKLISYQTDPKPFGDWSAIKAWNNPGAGNYGETSCTTAVKPWTNTNCYNGHTGTSNPVP